MCFYRNIRAVTKLTSRASNICMQLSHYHHDVGKSSSGEIDALKDRILQEVVNDPQFLRDIIQKVRHDGCNSDPKIIEATNILTEYFLKADINKDGVITRDEMRTWLRRTPHEVEEAVRYVPEGSDDDVQDSIHPPTSTQLRQHIIKIGIPFVGFGFLDNAVMIIAGSEIESYFGLSLGISAMAAAGLGNTLSDIVGIQAGGAIEALSDRMGIKDPNLTREQLKSKSMRMWTILASMLGITLGCLLGMLPLLFMNNDKDQALRLIFDSVDTDKSGKLELKELDVLFDLLSKSKYIDNPQQARVFMRECGYDEEDALSFVEFKSLFNAYMERRNIDSHVEGMRSTRAMKVQP